MMRTKSSLCLAPVAALLLSAATTVHAYPEFQRYIQQNSGRTVNCAMCHAHPDGPVGNKVGQIGRLTPSQLDELGTARTALDPGTVVHNPILNDFGNSIVQQVGRTRLLTLRVEPEKLADSLSPNSDIDGDGLPDAREVREGTDPLDPNHGNPWALFRINFQRNIFHLIMAGVATFLGLFGLNHLLHGLHVVTKGHKRSGDSISHDSHD